MNNHKSNNSTNSNTTKTKSIIEIIEEERTKHQNIRKKKKQMKNRMEFFAVALVVLAMFLISSLKGILILIGLVFLFITFYKDQLPSIKKLKQDGSLRLLKHIFYWVVTLFVASVCIATFKVLFLEQTSGGTHAITTQCVEWDIECSRYCQETQYDNPRSNGSSCDCCIKEATKLIPIGERLVSLIKEYVFYTSGLSFVLVVVSTSLINERKK